ncbi:cation-translocating P-type ATPase [Bilifractor sp. HCP3S3_D3]|uniref:cation-translocating P-type ATPase n=1 Tax=Bilifractor sp. HCP3S3_D3 TaxID=3438907 RepID=UPI003F8C9E0B
MADWYQKNSEESLQELHSSKEGLTDDEVRKRQEQYGFNELKEKKKESVLQVFLGQFKDLMVIILIIAATISMLTGDVESTLVIFAVLVLNAVLGTVQHVKAEKSLEALKALSSPTAKVIRNGTRVEVESRQVVPGDILVAEAGDLIVADGRILENYSLQVNESSLTGESLNVDKSDAVLNGDLPLADRKNMVYSGSLVTYGRAVVLVTETGMQTEIGRIATLMNQTGEKKTPLQKNLDDFSKKLATGILIISAVIFVLGIVRGMELLNSLLFAVALAVAAIPEALSSIVTIVQAMGTQKMAREHAVIKKLSAVESLGCVSVICSDKTGTLTQNKMTVQQIYAGGRVFGPEEFDMHQQTHRYLLYDSVLTNDATLSNGKGVGDPTEYALLEMYGKVKGLMQKEEDLTLSYEDLRTMLRRIEEVPFDSDRKLMSTKHRIHGVSTIFTKGAVDVLLDRCDSIRISDEEIRPITEEDRKNITEQNRKFSENGLRVLAFAYRESEEELSPETEYHFTFLGLISEMDPPREESVQAVQHAKEAGIRTVMITGDHKITATAIAKQIGIFQEGDLAVTGMELDDMSDEELNGKIEKISVYARVSPENKIRIVDAWQKKGKIVSMTGDGVNDAPALKKADIGVAMGITGTEVSKDAASMILEDDNFATIIKAVANGRTIYTNIRNAVLYLLSGNLSAIITVLVTSLLALPIPFQPVQLLFINLVTDSLPALAIGMEPGSDDVLKKKPRDPKAGIMDRNFALRMIFQGGLISVAVIIAYHIGLGESPAMACSLAFLTLTCSRLLHGFNCRGEKSLLRLGFRKNPYSLGAFLLGLVLVILVSVTPVGRSLFSVSALNSIHILTIGVLALIPTAIIQIVRIIQRK